MFERTSRQLGNLDEKAGWLIASGTEAGHYFSSSSDFVLLLWVISLAEGKDFIDLKLWMLPVITFELAELSLLRSRIDIFKV